MKYLGHDDLISATLVNKRWNEIISNSKIFLEKTRLKIVAPLKKKCPEEFTRNYQHIYLGLVKVTSSMQMKRFNEFLQSVKITSGCNMSQEILEEFLRSCSNSLKELTLYEFFSVYRESKEIKKISLPNLTRLDMHNSSKVMDLIECENIEYFRFYDFKECNISWYTFGFMSFLNHLKKLQTLELSHKDLHYHNARPEYENVNILQLKFNWKELRVSGNEYNQYYLYWQQLISKAAPKSEFHYLDYDEFNYIDNEIAKNENIIKLIYNITSEFPKTLFDWSRPINFCYIKELEVILPEDHENYLNFFIQFLKIEKLKLEFKKITNITNWIHNEGDLIFHNLQSLILSGYAYKFVESFKLPELKFLEIKDFNTENCEHLKEFLKDKLNISHIKIQLKELNFPDKKMIEETFLSFGNENLKIEIY